MVTASLATEWPWANRAATKWRRRRRTASASPLSFVCTATQPLGAPPGEREGGQAVGGRFGFPLFALVSMTICRPPVTVTRNKDGKSEWSKFGEEGEWQGVSKRRDDDDGMGKSLRIVGGLVGIWHHFFEVTRGKPQLGEGIPVLRGTVSFKFPQHKAEI